MTRAILSPMIWVSHHWKLVLLFTLLNFASLIGFMSIFSPQIYETSQGAMDAIEPAIASLSAPWGAEATIDMMMLPDAWWWHYSPQTLLDFHAALGDARGTYWTLRLWDTLLEPWVNLLASGGLAFLMLRGIWHWQLPNKGSETRPHMLGYIVPVIFILGLIAEIGEFSMDIIALTTGSKLAATGFFWANTLKQLTLVLGFMLFTGVSIVAWPFLYLSRRQKN